MRKALSKHNCVSVRFDSEKSIFFISSSSVKISILAGEINNPLRYQVGLTKSKPKLFDGCDSDRTKIGDNCVKIVSKYKASTNLKDPCPENEGKLVTITDRRVHEGLQDMILNR